ncbi:MAG: glycosyltransferase family 4 protein [Rhodocyclaceae bacterium]|nr:glycosyltransferase family 4 protein [Rhodocyclaceae bacterium]MCO5097803.1 glycosyltransferase [Rhodocyclaceae bacterium]
MRHLQTLVVSTSYPRQADDWRGRFIADLVAALPGEGVGVSLWAPPGPLPAGVVEASSDEERAWLDRLAEAGGIASRLRAGPLPALSSASGLLRRLWRAYRREVFDVAHVNWLQNALPLIGTQHPAVIGVLGSDYGLLRLPGMVALIKSALAGRRALLAPNSPWMVPRLEALFGSVATVRVLPFGVAPEWFSIERRPLSQGAPWLAVMRVTKAKIGDLFKWGAGLFGASRPLVLLGPMQEDIALPAWIDYRGATHPGALRNEWFPSAAGLITLSRHDEGRPQVMIEAMAAGLPIIASDLPAHGDLVDDANGRLVSSREALASALDDLSGQPRSASTGMAGRDRARREIGDWRQAAARFRAAYRELLLA